MYDPMDVEWDYFDDWYDPEDYREPDPPGCGKCNDSGAVWARIGASRGRVRRCPSCDPAWLRRLWLDLRWWWWHKRNPANVSGEAPF